MLGVADIVVAGPPTQLRKTELLLKTLTYLLYASKGVGTKKYKYVRKNI